MTLPRVAILYHVWNNGDRIFLAAGVVLACVLIVYIVTKRVSIYRTIVAVSSRGLQ